MATKPKSVSSNPGTIEFKYIFPPDFNPVYTNGAWGGIGPQGDLVVNFYLERAALPLSVTHSFEEDGTTLGPEISRDPPVSQPTLVRYVSTGVVMDEACARRIHKWLGSKIQQFDANKKAAK